MARVFKKRDEWWIDYRANGQRHREPVGASHSLAKEVLSKRLAEVAEQRHFPGRAANAQTFNDVATKFWDLHGKAMRSATWIYMLGKLRAEFGQKKIGDITPADAQRFYNATKTRCTLSAAEKAVKRAGAVSPDEAQRIRADALNRPTSSTANRYLCLLRSIFNKAESWGEFVGKNPCKGVKIGREATGRLRFLSVEEMTRLLAVVDPGIYPVVACALLTGMRRGEILGLTWDNVDLDGGTLYISKSKSGLPRQVPIPSKLREVFLALGPKASGQIFNLTLCTLQYRFLRALKNAEIFGFHFHDLRHTFASHFLMRTNDITALQRLLGHANPSMTLRYAHLSRGHMAANIEAFQMAIPVKPAITAAAPIPALSGHQDGHQALICVLSQV